MEGQVVGREAARDCLMPVVWTEATVGKINKPQTKIRVRRRRTYK